MDKSKWDNSEAAPLAVVMISLNEGHNMRAVLENLKGFADEVFLVDSFSSDDTIDIALEYGVHIVQKEFKGFGAQWNFALENLPIKSAWTMKLDPDERLSDELKHSIRSALGDDGLSGYEVLRRIWFMGRPLPVMHRFLRIWRTGRCHFSDVLVNEHPIIEGSTRLLSGNLEHHDSPHLHHWLDKQNRYTTAEAIAAFRDDDMAVLPRLLGTPLERRMWFKKRYMHVPFRHFLMFLYCWCVMGAWRAGYAGFSWARLRTLVYQMIDYKIQEMKRHGNIYIIPQTLRGMPDERVQFFDEG